MTLILGRVNPMMVERVGCPLYFRNTLGGPKKALNTRFRYVHTAPSPWQGNSHEARGLALPQTIFKGKKVNEDV